MSPRFLLRVTSSANRNSYRVATPYYIYTQGRGAAPLNPGLRNRNSYRVAAACGPQFIVDDAPAKGYS